MLASRISSKAAFTRQRTGQAHSRRNAAAPRHPTRQLSTGPAPPRHGTTTLPWRPCTAPHSRVSTLPIADNRHSEHTPSDDTHKHWQTTSAPTHTSMMQRVPGRGSTQGMQDISPEPLTPQIPALPHAAARSGCRGAPGSPASPKRLVRAREDGGEDGSPTLVLAQEVE